jgi:hypothetical protein
MVNGHKEKVDDAKVLYKEPTSQNGQIPLTSIKPSEEYEEGLRHNAEAAPHKDVGPGVEKGMKKRQDVPSAQQEAPHLASGRQAGAGWQNSAYV